MVIALICAMIVFVLLAFIASLEAATAVFFGWIGFLMRVVPELSANRGSWQSQAWPWSCSRWAFIGWAGLPTDLRIASGGGGGRS